MTDVSPTIIIGCHRSGTSILTRLLERLGLFVGSDLESHNESNTFIRINSWLMRECGGAWDQPEPVANTLADSKSRRALASYISELVESRFFAPFLGWRRWLRHRGRRLLPFPWGWKDPRSTITLPVWREIFPRAKVVHIRRHGVDVASSLHRRQVTRRNEDALRRIAKGLKDKLSWRLTDPLERQRRLPGSQRCSSLSGSFDLWKFYEDEAERHVAGEETRNVRRLRYEDVVDDPVAQLADLIEFSDLDATLDEVRAASEVVDPDRDRAYREDESLVQFAEEREEVLARYGYSA